MQGNYWAKQLRRRIARRQALAIGATTAFGAAFLAACGGSSDDASSKSELVSKPVDTSKSARRGGVAKFFTNADTSSFDPAIANTALGTLKQFVYGNLATAKPGYLEAGSFDLVPELAESWEWSPDRLQLTFKLRPGVKWHNKPPINGRAFEVEDVLASWERFTRVSSGRASLAASANPSAPVLSVSAPDAKTVSFKLQYPIVYVLALIAFWGTGQFSILPKETDGTFDVRRDMIGTGGFMLSKYEPSAGFTFQRNPDFYEKDFPLVDQVERPIISEYAAGVAQLKAGNVYTYDVRNEDALPLKREAPDLVLYQGPMSTSSLKTAFGWLPAGRSPFLDERVRQAYSMALDRDLWIDTFYNVSQFRSEGLPIETAWNGHVNTNLVGWALDPRDKDFGSNAKYFEYNLAEAKKLLAAAGYPNGVDLTSTYISGTQYGIGFQRQAEVIEAMAAEAGLRVNSKNIIDYNTEFIPKYRDSKGNFEGWAYKIGAPPADDPVAFLFTEFHSGGGANFYGFDISGKSDNSGDQHVDAEIEKARAELDTEKRRAIVHEVQRYLAKKMYLVRWPGGATGFNLAWPALKNFNVYQNHYRGLPFHWWVDDTLPPFKKA